MDLYLDSLDLEQLEEIARKYGIPIPIQPLNESDNCDSISSIPTLEQYLYLTYKREQANLDNNKPPGPRQDLESMLNSDHNIAFMDNTAYIKETLDTKKIGSKFIGATMIIRPKRFGKTTFGRLWLEFFKGNIELLQNTEIVKTLPIPPKNYYVCVELSFAAITPLSFDSDIAAKFNRDLLSSGITDQITDSVIILGTGSIIKSFANILHNNKRSGAIFVDEYDGIVRKSIADPTIIYNTALLTTKTFFLALKDQSDDIPLILATGSSRISLKDVWSGSNDSKEVSYDGDWANTFGYRWSDLERLYSVQLGMLERLYNISRDNLKGYIQSMYGGYLFSPASNEEIFNTWAINRFIEFGKFSPYFSTSGLSNILTNGSFAKSTIEVLSNIDHKIDQNIQTMTDWKFEDPTKPQNDTDTYMQLHSAGILTFVYGGIGDNINLIIPNRDAIYAIQEILVPSAKSINSNGFNTLIRNFNLNDAIGLARPNICKIALSTGIVYEKVDTVLEYHLQHAFFATLELLSNDLKGSACWKRRSELPSIGKKRMDFVIIIPSANLGSIRHVIEFGRYDGNMNMPMIKQLLAKLEQARKYCEEYSARLNVQIMMASASIWSYKAELLCGAGPFHWQDVKRISAEISAMSYDHLKDGHYPNLKIYDRETCSVKEDGTY